MIAKRRNLKLPKAVYMHVMDSTEGIPGNKPKIVLTTSRNNPFGVPGRNYSAEYPWTCIKFVPAEKEQP